MTLIGHLTRSWSNDRGRDPGFEPLAGMIRNGLANLDRHAATLALRFLACAATNDAFTMLRHGVRPGMVEHHESTQCMDDLASALVEAGADPFFRPSGGGPPPPC